jgi:hypothetical protein
MPWTTASRWSSSRSSPCFPGTFRQSEEKFRLGASKGLPGSRTHCYRRASLQAEMIPDSSAVELSTVNRAAVGSNPTQGAISFTVYHRLRDVGPKARSPPIFRSFAPRIFARAGQRRIWPTAMAGNAPWSPRPCLMAANRPPSAMPQTNEKAAPKPSQASAPSRPSEDPTTRPASHRPRAEPQGRDAGFDGFMIGIRPVETQPGP